MLLNGSPEDSHLFDGDNWQVKALTALTAIPHNLQFQPGWGIASMGRDYSTVQRQSVYECATSWTTAGAL